jgi:hypothetical protein
LVSGISSSAVSVMAKDDVHRNADILAFLFKLVVIGFGGFNKALPLEDIDSFLHLLYSQPKCRNHSCG